MHVESPEIASSVLASLGCVIDSAFTPPLRAT
ncbi:hypothetical protein AVEN_1489-1, partial [Araneus ventricosus]